MSCLKGYKLSAVRDYAQRFVLIFNAMRLGISPNPQGFENPEGFINKVSSVVI